MTWNLFCWCMLVQEATQQIYGKKYLSTTRSLLLELSQVGTTSLHWVSCLLHVYGEGLQINFFLWSPTRVTQPENERGITAMLEEYGQGSDDSTRLMVVAESKRGCRISSVKALQRGESGDQGVRREKEKELWPKWSCCNVKYFVNICIQYKY